MLRQVGADEPRERGDQQGLGVSLDDDDTMGKEEVGLSYVEKALQELVVARVELRLALGEREGAPSLQDDEVLERDRRCQVGAVRGEDDLHGSWRLLDPARGRFRQEVHQAELSLRVKVRFWFFDKEQRQPVRLPSQQQQFARHVEDVVRPEAIVAACGAC